MWELVLAPIFKIIDKVVPDPQEAARQKQAILEMQQRGEFRELEERYKAITTEAASGDPYTSRARPSFMYVFYIVVLSLVIAAPLIGLINKDLMVLFYTNVKTGFDAIPDIMWNTFLMGYVGYTMARTVEKNEIFKKK